MVDFLKMREVFPKVFYKRLQVSHLYEKYYAKIDLAYGYLLTGIRLKYPMRVIDYTLAAQWQPVFAYVPGNVIRPTNVYQAANPNVLFLECTVGGNSGAGEPAWGRQTGALVVDGAVTWRTFDPRKTGVGGNAYCRTADLSVQLIDHANDHLITEISLLPDNISSPGRNESYLYDSFQAADNTGYSKNWSSNPCFRSQPLNILYRFGDVVVLNFSNIQLFGALYVPDYIDVMITGYYVPDFDFQLHNKGKILIGAPV
jgi:hypothetical protein